MMEQQADSTVQNSNHHMKEHRHCKVVTAFQTLDGNLHWFFNARNIRDDEDENVEVRFFILMKNTPAPQKGEALSLLFKALEGRISSWFAPDRKEWAFDLEKMKQEFSHLATLDWFTGRVYVEPEFEVKKEAFDISKNKYYETHITFYINPKVLGIKSVHNPPEILDSLREFRLDHPDPKKVAFIMMRFGRTRAHEEIVEGIKQALAPHGIHAVRADDKDWHSDLYYNVVTCLYGCGFGIAVFERIESDDFNPNVALEVGYIMALGKPVCLLKDQTLTSLHTDLVGKLYKTFDPQDPITSIPSQLTKWMQDRKII
jgi:hypothetical protein